MDNQNNFAMMRLAYRFYLLFLCTLVAILFSGDFVYAQVVINEVCAYNGDNITDEDGEHSDWIELYNYGTTPVNLQNYALQGDNPEPWFFPAVIMQPQSFLLVYASGKNKTGPVLHTSFKLAKEGETIQLYDSFGILSDMLQYPLMQIDHSFGRKPDGLVGTKGIFNSSSAGSSNFPFNQYMGYATDPVISLAPGMYNNQGTLEITGCSTGFVHYTIDGSEPDLSSPLYTAPLILDVTKVIRARCFSTLPGELPSNEITNTYILDYNQNLPVFSITTKNENLWDWNTGIYVTGPNASPNYPYYGANYWQDWEVKAHIEFFESDGSLVFSQDAGLSIHGGSSNRTKPMKSLRLTNRKKYGSDKFKHRFFEDKNIDAFKIIVLRNSSGDFNKTHFRDGCLHKLMSGKLDIDILSYRPSAVFLNGVYHGVHNIREKIGKNYLEENYGIDGDNIDLLEEDSLVLEGDFNAFNSMHAFVTGNDMSQQVNFNVASGMIDTKSLCDYYIAETFLSNIDWPYNNIKFWRVREPGAKWRYILMDLDIALGNNGWAPADFDLLGRIMGPYGDNNRHVQILRSLLQNAGFREYFINRYADLVNTIFKSENLDKHIVNVRKALEKEMPLHFVKWGNDMNGWDHEIFEVAMPHVYDRPAFAFDQVKNVFELDGIVDLELDVWPPGAGNIIINTITPEPLPWKGKYFDGNPITVHVQPKTGFHFVMWTSFAMEIEDAGSNQIRFNPQVSTKLTAFFSTTKDASQLMIFPNPVKETLDAGFVLEKPARGHFEIINYTGQVVQAFEEMELKRGLNSIQLNVSHLTTGVYALRLVLHDGIKVSSMIKL